MNNELKFTRTVFDASGGLIYTSEGDSPNPLKYASKGTLKELSQAKTYVQELETKLATKTAEIAELEELVKEIRVASFNLISSQSDNFLQNAKLLTKILSNPKVQELMEKKP